MAVETDSIGVDFLYQQLVLSDDLTMNFEVTIEESIAQKAVAQLTVGDAVTSYTVSHMTTNINGNYVFSVDVAAAQMTENINVSILVDNSVIAEHDYTVKAYAEALLMSDCSDETKALLIETLNYGAKAQSYFNYNVGVPANAGYEDQIVPVQVPTETPEVTVEGSVSGISYYGSSMLFTGKLAIRYYFTAPNGVENYTFSANGSTYHTESKDGLYYVDVAGINPQDIDETVVLTVSDGSSNLSVGYGPMHYITRMYNGKGSESLKALLQAMYGYHCAAEAYISSGENTPTCAVYINGETELLVGSAKPDFSTYFTVIDPVDGVIIVKNDMLSDNVNMNQVGTYEVHLACENSEGQQVNKTLEIKVVNSASVAEAIALLGTETPVYIDGYVAGYSYDGTVRKAIILQDTQTGECIEFWGTDSEMYNDIWSTYEVGDHVAIHASSIIDNRGLPRANAMVTPIAVNGSYKLSTGNEIKVTEITDLDSFLNSVYTDGGNTLGVYTCTTTVADSNYFHQVSLADGNLRIQLYQSAATPVLKVGSTYTIQFVLTGYNKALDNTGNLYIRTSVVNENDVVAVKESAEYTVSINGETELLVGSAKPDFSTYFTVVDSIDGQIAITNNMLTDNVDMNTAGVYEVVLDCENSQGDFIKENLEIRVVNDLGVSDAIKLLNTNTPTRINGYVAGFVKNGDGNHTAVILQDAVTGECIEFWANDHVTYRDIWNTYEVGDYVTISTDKIVSNKGLPRAGSAKNGTYPVAVDGSYKISTGNEIKAVEISDMEAFLQDAITNGTNILGKYSYTGMVTNEDGYLYVTDKGDGYKLKLDLYNSPVSASFQDGKIYNVTFVVLGYNKALSTEEDITLRIAVMNEGDLHHSLSVSEAVQLLATDTSAYVNGYVAGYVKNNDGNHTAVILQDSATGECIEFWANDHSTFRQIWNTYEVGDHVTIYTDKIVSNKGLPRAGSAKNGTYPVAVDGSYKISTGNEIQAVEIADMEAFLQDAITNGTNILGKYTYTGTITNEDGYLYVTDKGDGYKLKLDLYYSPVSATFEAGKDYKVTFVILAYNKALSTAEDITLRIAIMNEGDVRDPAAADYTVDISGKTDLLIGTEKPDFSTYFAITDSVDGKITITNDMLTDNVDMSTIGTYEVTLSCENSEGKYIRENLEINVVNSMSVSEAVTLLGTEKSAYISGYVAGYSLDGTTRKAIILQDTVTSECIEFWGSDSSAYSDIWNSYEIGDHVVIYTDSIVDNKGLPRANATVTPVEVDGSYKISSGNEIQVTEIADLDAFLNAVYTDRNNALGVYTCTVTVADANYLHEIALTNGTLRLQIYQSVVVPELTVGSTYKIKFVLTGFSRDLDKTGNLYIRASVLEESDVVEVALRAMSFNMRYENQNSSETTVYTWQNRKGGIAECLNNYSVDIVGTQELQCWQYDELIGLLGDNWAGVGLPRNGSNTERNAIIYNTETVEYISGETIWLSETPDVPGSISWGSSAPRILTYGKFLYKPTQTEFYFFNTHLDHVSAEARANQLALVVSYMDKYSADYSVILTGDFNANTSDGCMVSFTNKSDVYDHTYTPFLEELGTEMQTYHGFNGGTTGSPIDYIFYSKETLSVKSTQIIHDTYQETCYLSDHYPVISVFSMNNTDAE